MPITNIVDARTSDILLSEEENSLSRQTITVNMSTGATLLRGTVLARAKNADLTTAYDIVKSADLTNSATALGKEFIILGGDGYSFKQSVTFVTSTAKSAIGWFRDASFKETQVRALHAGFSDAEWGLLKGALLATQNLRLVPTATAVPA